MDPVKIIAINGSPRKSSTTAKLLKAFLEGAESVGGVSTELIDIYDLQFTGCRECFLCKIKGGKMYGTCGFKDGAKDALKRASECDGLAFGAPVFLGDFSAQGKAFVERLLFPMTSYEGGDFSLFKGKKPTAVFGTMNVKEDFMREHYMSQFENTVGWFESIYHERPFTLFSTNTYQFNDYSRYDAGLWNEEEKRRWRDERLPKDIEEARRIGRGMAEDLIARRD